MNNNSPLENHMLHTVLSGHPGSGKTTVAMILAHIWMALGLIKSKSAQPSPETQLVNLRRELLDAKIKANAHADRVLDEMARISKTRHRTRNLQKQYDFRARPYPSKHKLNQIHAILGQNDDDLEEVQRGLGQIYCHYHQEITSSESSPSDPVDPYEHAEPNFIIADRETLIGEYIGQTSIKTKAILEKARGGVLFIDEAYNLVNSDSKRDFGHECLTMINEYMSKYPDELIVIFAGYRDKLEETIFKSQPGLSRRCGQTFHIERYSSNGLGRIFQQQLGRTGWAIDPKVDLGTFFQENSHVFVDGGGSTEKLIMHCKFAYGQSEFRSVVDKPGYRQNSLITRPILEEALRIFRENSFTSSTEPPPPPLSMYL